MNGIISKLFTNRNCQNNFTDHETCSHGYKVPKTYRRVQSNEINNL